MRHTTFGATALDAKWSLPMPGPTFRAQNIEGPIYITSLLHFALSEKFHNLHEQLIAPQLVDLFYDVLMQALWEHREGIV